MRFAFILRPSVSVLKRLHPCRNMSSASSFSPSFSEVEEAMERVREVVHFTPVLTSSHLDSLAGHSLFFKCETFQKAGSFKIRGATNMIKKHLAQGSESDGRSGTVGGVSAVVTHSSGNHAQAVSLASRLCGVPAHIVMPKGSPKVKVQAVQDYGGIVTFSDNNEQSRISTAQRVLESLGPRALMVPSSNHPDIMAGQGTVAMEFLKQVPELDVIVGSVSGGGFVAGMSIAAKSIKTSIKIVAAEPLNADDTARSFAAGHRITNTSPPQTVADGLKVNVGELTWPILKTHLIGVVTVTEEEIISATKLVWERMKLVIEPSAGCTVAAVLTQQFRELVGPHTQRVGVVLCGGNVDLDRLPWTPTAE